MAAPLARRVSALAGACHPAPVVAVTAASVADAVRVGRGAVGTLLVGAAVLAGQCSVGWQNDAVDAERDRRAQRSDKPVARDEVSRRTVEAAWVLAGVAVVPLSLASGWRAGVVHLVAVAMACAYNLRLKATPASFVPYVVAFGLLPCFVTLGLPGAPLPPWWVPAGTALLGLAAHGANVLPDLEFDREAGIWGLPQRIGKRASLVLMSAALSMATAVLALGPALSARANRAGVGPDARWALCAAALVVSTACAAGAVSAALRRSTSRAPFALVVVAAMSDVALVLLEGRPIP